MFACIRGDNNRNMNMNSPTTIHTILVIQQDNYDWDTIFKKVQSSTSNPLSIRVIQTDWNALIVGPCSDGKALVTVKSCWKDGVERILDHPLTIRPDFLLIRNEVVSPTQDHRNKLLGLIYSNVPSINSLKSILTSCDKPVVQSALYKIRKAHFKDNPQSFPLIPQEFFPSTQGFFYGNAFPAVIKFGSAHAGVGKLKVMNHHDMEDVRGLLCMTKDGYATGEPYINKQCDLRIQKIGSHGRAFRRVSVSGNWKSNMGSAIMESIPMTPLFHSWIEAVTNMFGSDEDDKLDILTVDAIVGLNSNELKEDVLETQTEIDINNLAILEVNGTSSGLHPDCADEDNLHIAELVLNKLNVVLQSQ